MGEKKKYILKPKSGIFTLTGTEVQLILEKVREYIKYYKGWFIALIIMLIFQFFFNIISREDNFVGGKYNLMAGEKFNLYL